MGKVETSSPAGWTQSAVDKVGAVQLGLMRSPDKNTGRFRTKYIRAANITTSGLSLSDVLEMDFPPADRERYQLRSGDILLAEASGSPSQVGRPAIWKNEIPDCCFQNTVIRFRPFAVIPEYALIVFRHYFADGRFARIAKGVGIQHLTAGRFSAMPFPVPPWPEQERIVAEASRRLADLREAKSRINSALAHLEAQINEILSSVVDNTLGSPKEIPAPWKWGLVKDGGEIRAGRQLTPEASRGPHQRKYLRVANVHEDYIDYTDVKKMSFSSAERTTYRLRTGDVLLNEGQSIELVGRPAMFRGEIREVYYQNHLLRFRANDKVDPEFALLVFRQYLRSGKFQQIARRSTNIANLGLKRFAEMPFPLPPLREQIRIATLARRLLKENRSQTTAAQSALGNTQQLEHELLRAAISGLLIPQNANDEPARLLLARSTPSPIPRTKRTPKQAKTSEVPDDDVPLVDILEESNRPLSAAELFARSGFDRDSTEDVERFYLTLRAVIGKKVQQREDGERSVLVIKGHNAP